MRALAAAYSSRSAWRSRWSSDRLSHSAIHGRNVVVVSSWKLLTSTTCTVSGVDASTCADSGTPMLPPTSTGRPPDSSIRPITVTVVDFPFVPVTAITRPLSHREASSISPIVSTPRADASSKAGWRSGTPGLTTIRSASPSVRASCPPSSSATPSARRGSAAAMAVRMSVNVTRAPRRASSSAAATPLRAAPTTTTRLPATEKTEEATTSPQLQRRQAEQRKQDRDDDEARDHLGLAPPDQLEVMMERRHAEHPPAGHLEPADLDDDRQRLEHPDAADHHQQQLLLDKDGHGADGAAEPQGADVAHEDLGGIGVVPEEPEAGADQRAAEDRQLAGVGEVRQQQVAGQHGVAGHIRQGGEGGCSDAKRADGESVQTIGEVHRIGRAHQHQHDEEDVPDAEIRRQVLEEREDQLGAVDRRPLPRAGQPDDGGADGHGHQDQRAHLVARHQPVVRAARQLQVVVGEAHGTAAKRGRHRNPHERVGEIGPEQRRQDRRRQDQDAAHRRRARLGAVRLRPFLADDLANLEVADLADEPGPDDQAEDQRAEARRGGAEGDVARDVKEAEK